jgi:hypothetical protein
MSSTAIYLLGYLVDEIPNKVKWGVLANICGELKDVDLDLCNVRGLRYVLAFLTTCIFLVREICISKLCPSGGYQDIIYNKKNTPTTVGGPVAKSSCASGIN